MELHLSQRDQWTGANGTYVSGSAFFGGSLLKESDLAAAVAETDTKTELRALLEDANGLFSLVHEIDGTIYAAVDHVRSWPLYYAVTDDIYVSDSAEWIHQQGSDRGYDPIAATEYLFTAFVPGSGTLSRDVRQVQAGELVTLDSTDSGLQSETERYFRYTPSECSEPVTQSDLDEVLTAAFERLIKYADGRPILLGLSGGYDSRLIALFLKRLGYENTITYTTQTASENSAEMDLAASIADDLAFQHLEISSARSDYQDFEESRQMNLIEDVGYLSEYPHVNKEILRQKLRAEGVEPESVVHVLGHHVLGGGAMIPDWVRDQQTLSREEFCDLVWNLHYSGWETPGEPRWQKLFQERMLERLPTNLYDNGTLEATADAVSGYEELYWQERLPKYVTARREYETLGFDMWYPLLDQAVYDYFQRSRYRDRVGKRVLKEYVRNLDSRIRATESDLEPADRQPIQSLTDAAWGRSVALVHALPSPVTEFIRDAYNDYQSTDLYMQDPRYNIVPEAEFERFSFPNVYGGSLYRTLLALYLYDNDFFDLPIETEYDRALAE